MDVKPEPEKPQNGKEPEEMTSRGAKQRASPLWRGIRWMVWSVLTLLVALALLLASVQTGTGRRVLVSWVAAAVQSATGYPIRIGPVHGLLPLDIRVESLELGDVSDPWLRAREIAFQWFPGSLLKGRIRIGLIEASKVDIRGLPPEGTAGTEDEAGAPSWPTSLPPILLEHFAVKRLTLSREVLGQAAELTVSARMALAEDGRTIRGACEARRVDGFEERMAVKWVLHTAPPHLDLDVEMAEPEEGLLSRLAGMNAGAVRLRIRGKGPPGGWNGEIDAESGRWGSMRSMLHVRAGEDRLGVRAKGSLTLKEGLLPPGAEGVLKGGTCAFSLDGAYTDRGLISVDRLVLSTEELEAAFSGQYEAGGIGGRAQGTLSVPRVDRIASFLPAGVGGSLRVRVHAQKDLDKLKADAHLEIDGLQAPGATAARAAGTFRFQPADGAAFPFLEGLRVSGKGAFHELRARAGERILEIPEVGWSFDAGFREPDTLFVQSLRITDGNISLTADGTTQLRERSLTGSTHLDIADMSRALLLKDAGLKGRAELSARIRGNDAERALEATLDGTLQGLGPLPRGLIPVVGDSLRFDGRVALKDGRSLEVSSLRVGLRGGELQGRGRVDLINETGDASLRAEVPDAALLSDAAGRTLRGSAVLEASLGGNLRNPEVEGVLTVRRLGVDRFQAGEGRVTFQAMDLGGSPRADVNVTLDHGGETIQGKAAVVLRPPQVEIRDLSLEGFATRMEGSLNVDSNGFVLEGDLNVTIADLAPLSGLAGENLGGRGTVSVNLTRRDIHQDVTARIGLRDLKGHAALLRKADFLVNGKDVFRDASGTLEGSVSALEGRALRVEDLHVKARGHAGSVEVEVDGSGEWLESFHGAVRGGVRFNEQETLMEIASVEGVFGTTPLKLEKPCRIRLQGREGIEAESFLLRVGDGRVEIEGRLGETSNLQAGFGDLPLSLFTAAGLPPMNGRTSGTVHVSGSGLDPRVDLSWKAASLDFADPSFTGFPSLGFSAHASIEGGRLRASGSVTGLGERPLDASFEAPVTFTLSPFSFVLERENAIQGRLQAVMALDPVPAWLSLPDHRLTGRLEADVTVEGSLASPEVQGGVRIKGASYENLRGGTVLQDLDLALRLSQGTVTLEHARATDGGDGRMEMDGNLRLVPEEDYPFSVRLTLDRFRPLRLEDLDATAGADMVIKGSASAAAVSGKAVLASAHLRIPDRMPLKIQELEVVDVRASGSPPRPKPADSPPAGGPDISLDIRVEVPGQAFVRGRGLDSEWKGALTVTGDADRPSVRGELEIVRGQYDFFGKRFSLASGSLILDGTYPPAPYMNVTAEHRATDVTAQVHLTGTPDSLRLQITSDPPMPQDEVMARLLFGRSLTSITPFQAVKLARAMDALAGGKTFGFMDRVQEAAGVDQVDVRPGEEGKEMGSLSVGKYMGEGVYMEVEKGLSSEEGKVSLEYEVTPQVTVETEVGTDTKGGVEVKWKWDY